MSKNIWSVIKLSKHSACCGVDFTAPQSASSYTYSGRRFFAGLIGVLGLASAIPAYCETVFQQEAQPVFIANKVNSQALAKEGGGVEDVTVFDNFMLKKTSFITTVSWRGSSSDKSLIGFTVKFYTSKENKSASPEIDDPLVVNSMIGTAKENRVGSYLSDYRMNLSQPIALAGGEQYWISIVANRKDGTAWVWASGSGGDDKSVKSSDGVKVRSVAGDRAFTLSDERSASDKR